jgi:hypothetical protein
MNTRLNSVINNIPLDSYEGIILKDVKSYIEQLESLIKEIVPQHLTVVSSGEDGCASCYQEQGHKVHCPISRAKDIFGKDLKEN